MIAFSDMSTCRCFFVLRPLLPLACQSVRMKFLAVSPGVHTIAALTLTDIESGYSINLRWVVSQDLINSFMTLKCCQPFFSLCSGESRSVMDVVVHTLGD